MSEPDPVEQAGSGPAIVPPQTARASQMVEHFFRHETARLHGALTRRLGPQNLTLVEDVTQEALLRAMRAWSIGGIPDKPSAWITQVAMNLARDAMRHRTMAAGKEENVITHFEQNFSAALEPTGSGYEIADDSLRLMFVCCHPLLPLDAQVVLVLKVLCGFSTSEIARAFLSSEAAIEKQLTRTKQRIRAENIRFEIPEGPEHSARIDGVLAALYLLFNEGYKASAGERLLREELCREAIRLTSLLLTHPAGRTTRSHALLALMLLTTARFPSRIDPYGALLRLGHQDRSKWDSKLIEQGLFHLAFAAQGEDLSEYHIQAGIAACHCTADSYETTDWGRILKFYDDLARLKPSPLVELNRAVALAQLRGPEAGLKAISGDRLKERLEGHYLYHAVSGDLHFRSGNFKAAAESFRRALQLAQVGPEQDYLSRMLEKTVGDSGQLDAIRLLQ